MRVLVLGGSGMAGHMIVSYLEKTTDHEVWATLRDGTRHTDRSVCLDVRDRGAVMEAVRCTSPDVVINATGLLNQRAQERPRDAVLVNSLLPHVLVEAGETIGYRLIQISTDCVFSGREGSYQESDVKDGVGVYAQSKSLGEVIHPQHLTVRTSIIGPEIRADRVGLWEWFMAQTGSVPGFRRVLWNGVTTLELAKFIVTVLGPGLSGIVHLAASRKVSKFDLLCLMRDTFDRRGVYIEPWDSPCHDKTLRNTRRDVSLHVPDYPQMLRELRVWMERDQRYTVVLNDMGRSS